jgi:hypothetical protein
VLPNVTWPPQSAVAGFTIAENRQAALADHPGVSIVRSSSNGPIFAILGLAIWAGPSVAADNSAALHCATLSDDRTRLACYDGIFRAADSPPVPQATAAATAAAGAGASTGTEAAVAAAPGPLAAADPLADFGLTPAQQHSLDPEKAAEPRAPESISGTVARMGYKPTGELVVTLESGQVWMQIDTGSKPRVKAGDTVTIKRGSLGSYLLVSPTGMATRVRRLK